MTQPPLSHRDSAIAGANGPGCSASCIPAARGPTAIVCTNTWCSLRALLRPRLAGLRDEIQLHPRAAAKPARSEVERGPVRVTVEVQPLEGAAFRRAVLTLTIDTEEGVAVEKPPFGRTLGGFDIRDLREPLPKIDNGREVTPADLHAGADRNRASCGSTRSASRSPTAAPTATAQAHTVETEPLSIEVTSQVGDKTRRLATCVRRPGPSELPSHVARVALGSAGRRRRRCWPAWWLSAPPTPREGRRRRGPLARGACQHGVGQAGRVGAGRARHQAVLRRTDGHRAAIHRADDRHSCAGANHRGVFARDQPGADVRRRRLRCSRLRDFLESADLVKFAGPPAACRRRCRKHPPARDVYRT